MVSSYSSIGAASRMARTPANPRRTSRSTSLNTKARKYSSRARTSAAASSREHAAWALTDFGFLAVIAPSFADIFFSNAGKNGMVLVRLSEEDVNLLTHRSLANPAHSITINLEAQTITDDEGFSATFEIDPFRKYCLLNGLDDIGLTLRHEAELDSYESKHDHEFWLTPRSLTAA